ncbi:MAG TPA: hypothetical protein VF765_11790 [Polyangiaceae bacterium]
MSADKDKPDPPAGGGGKPATKTVVGVPALPASVPGAPAAAAVPPDEPSDAAMTRQMPAMRADDTAPREGPTAIDVKAMGRAEAERVLAWTGFSQEEIPTAQGTPTHGSGAPQKEPSGATKAAGTAGALPKPITQSVRLKTPSPSGGEMFPGLGRPATTRGIGIEPEKGTRSGVAPQAPVAPHGRSTLLLDNSAPPGHGQHDDAERPPIVVPGSGTTPPKAVTQPPPWGEGAARVAPSIPHAPPPVRPPEPSVEELSGSLLLPAEVTGELKAQGGVEELSGSVLIEDAPDGTPIVKPVSPAGAPVPRTPSVKPPVPKSSTRPSATQPVRPHLGGMPELPKATPAPKLDYVPNASGEPMAIPVPDPVPDPFADVQWLPPSAQAAQNADAQGNAQPTTSPMTGDIEVNQLPRGGIQPLLDATKRHWKRFLEASGPVSRRLLEQTKTLLKRAQAALPENTVLRSESRPKWFLPAVAVAGLVVGIGLVGLIVSAARGSTRAGDRPAASGSASRSLAASAAPGGAPAAAPAPAAPVVLPACTVVGPPHVIGPNATVSAGVEVVRAADDLAIGFAPSDHDAMAVRVDPASVSAITSTRATSHDPVKRVTPTVSGKGALSLVVDADRKNDRLQGRRTVLASPAVQLGAGDGHLAWSRLGGPPAGQLWSIDTGDPVDALRGAVENTGSQTIALAFRKGASVWLGTLDDSGSSLAVRGDLSHIDGLGTVVGSPVVAISDGIVLAAWSDRPSSDVPWKLRWVRFQAGQPAGPANAFAPPAGGKGEQTMSPGLAALPGGRFLLVWTEGPQSGHDVRALTLGPDGAPIGAPLTISTPGVNAGQGQAAVTESGAGVVAFLQTGGSGFEVVATPVSCGKP